MMNPDPRDRDSPDAALSALYRQTRNAEPPAGLDHRILATAEAAVARSAPRASGSRRRGFWLWAGSAALAVTVVLTVGLVRLTPESGPFNAALEPPSSPAAERDAGRAKSAEAVPAPPAALQTAPDRQERVAPRSVAPAHRLQQTAPASLPALDQERSSPAQWRADIAELRRQGRHAEAEARLEEFRRRYPAEPLEGDWAEPPH